MTMGFSGIDSLLTIGLFIEISMVSFSLSVVGTVSAASMCDFEAKLKGPFFRRSELTITAVDAALSYSLWRDCQNSGSINC